MPQSLPTTLLEDAVDIPTWLEADASKSLRERTRRDREIARQLGMSDNTARVRRWWQQIRSHDDDLPGNGIVRARIWVNLALVLIGVIGGTGLAFAAFAYDGTYPVNVVRLLALLVAPQLALLALNLLLIPGRLPGLRFVQDALSAVNPGALAAAVYRQVMRRPEAGAFGWAAAPSVAWRSFGKWQMLHWSQIAAVAFNLAVIATAVILIAFTDLAFGWSTTVNVASETAARIFSAIATPWVAVFPEAVPDPALIERSQFFRLDSPDSLPDSRELTRWWSFTVLAVIVYGLIPRVGFLLLTGWRMRAATRSVLLNDPRVAALLDRMSAPNVETRGASQEQSQAVDPLPGEVAPHAPPKGSAGAVIWGQAMSATQAAEFARARLGLSLTDIVEAGTGTLDADRETLACFAGGSDPVVVLTPAWEPPLLEFVDFLASLRANLASARSIVVVPVGEAMQEISSEEHENWNLAVRRSGDPRAYVETGDR